MITRIAELIEAALDNSTGSAKTSDVELRIADIHAGYGKKEVLRGVSLSVTKGEMLGIVGPNGSGKSTLLRVMAGFLDPTSGEVWIGNEPITSTPPHDRAKLGLAYFMQGGRVFPNLTVIENLEVGAISVRPEERIENIASALQLFPKLDHLRPRRAGLLSGGERQSLALAMLLIRRPRLLLLDEPSAGLSPKLVQELLSKLQDLTSSWGTTVLLVEQNIRAALSICERALVLVSGRVALETDRPVDWLTSGDLEQFFLGYKQ